MKSMKDINIRILKELDRKEKKSVKSIKGRFVRTFKNGQSVEITSAITRKEFSEQEHFNKFKKGQIVKVFFEYADGYTTISGGQFIDEYGTDEYTINIPTKYIKAI